MPPGTRTIAHLFFFTFSRSFTATLLLGLSFDMIVHFCSLFLFIFSTLVLIVESGRNTVRIERYRPCSPSAGPAKNRELVRFPSSSHRNSFVTQTRTKIGGTCLLLNGGTVTVNEPGLFGNRTYHVHMQIRFGIGADPEPCLNQDKNHCGGIGSCILCEACSTSTKTSNYAQILQRNQPIHCNHGTIRAGKYEDISLKICLPTKDNLLPLLDSNPKRAQLMWRSFINSKQTRIKGGLPLVIHARLYNRPINQLSTRQLNDFLHGSKTGMIGCHWIYATLYDL